MLVAADKQMFRTNVNVVVKKKNGCSNFVFFSYTVQVPRKLEGPQETDDCDNITLVEEKRLHSRLGFLYQLVFVARHCVVIPR